MANRMAIVQISSQEQGREAITKCLSSLVIVPHSIAHRYSHLLTIAPKIQPRGCSSWLRPMPMDLGCVMQLSIGRAAVHQTSFFTGTFRRHRDDLSTAWAWCSWQTVRLLMPMTRAVVSESSKRNFDWKQWPWLLDRSV
jgi:hypothetical protein